MPSSEICRRVTLVRTDVSEERITSIMRVERINLLGTALAANVIPCSLILLTLMMEVTRSSETSVLKRSSQRQIPEDGILHSHLRETLRSYVVLIA
jgi:hypothetical protein